MGLFALLGLLSASMMYAVYDMWDDDTTSAAAPEDETPPTEAPDTVLPDPVLPEPILPEPVTPDPVAPAGTLIFDEDTNALEVVLEEDQPGTTYAMILAEASSDFIFLGSGASGGALFDLEVFFVPEGAPSPTDPAFFESVVDDADRHEDGNIFQVDEDAYLELLRATYGLGQVDLGGFSTYDSVAPSYVPGSDFGIRSNVRGDLTITADVPVVGLELNTGGGGNVSFATSFSTWEVDTPFFELESEPGAGTVWVEENSFSSLNAVFRAYYSFSDGSYEGADTGTEIRGQVGEGAEHVVDIFARGGDDSIVLDSGFLGAVDAGAGDDTIIADSWTLIDGGDGDDVIDVNSAADSTLNGGNGDDVITVGFLDPASVVDAGAGDDVLNLPGGLSYDVTLGAGADSVTFRAEYRDALEPITITDFDPTQDMLVLEGDPALLGDPVIEIVQVPEENRTEIYWSYPVGEAEFSIGIGAILYLEAMPDITEEMIILPVPAAA